MIDPRTPMPGSPDEETLLILRPHWFTILPLLFGLGLLLVFPFAIWFWLKFQNPDFFDTAIYQTLFVLGGSIFFLFCWLFLFQQFMDHFLDVWIVTNRRIMDITQHGLFGRTTAEFMLDRVQDVTSEIKGFIPTMFDYGALHIQTAGEQQRFIFENIPHPVHISKRILELANESRARSGAE